MTTLIDTLPGHPLTHLRRWLNEAVTLGVKEANAMALATATKDGIPSVRIVLCKAIEDDAIDFYTNYTSRKAGELEANPVAAVVFHWAEIGRQVRLEGKITRASREASEAYFATRPKGSQVGAWTSRQSQPVGAYGDLVRAFDARSKELDGRPVPCPPFWGGYRLVPDVCEFWVSMPSRLHDRVLCRRRGDRWERLQLSP